MATIWAESRSLCEVSGLECPPERAYAFRWLAPEASTARVKWATYVAAQGITDSVLAHWLYEEHVLREKLGPLARRAVVYRDRPVDDWMLIRGKQLTSEGRAKLLLEIPTTQFAVDLLDVGLPPIGQRPGGLYTCLHWP